MMTMRKIRYILLLVAIANIAFISHSAPVTRLMTDTILRIDTITTNEVITRTEVIQKTEKVVRYYDNGKMVEKKLNDDITTNEETPVEINNEVIVNTVPSWPGDQEEYPQNAGGHYIWVPDSLEEKVNNLLKHGDIETGVVYAIEEERPFDLNEKVVFRGDTINMVLKDRNLGRYDRGLFNYLFIPKGIWQVGLTASYGEFSTEDLGILDLVSDVDFFGKLWSVRPYFQYFLKSNLSLGLRLGYTHGRANIGSFNMDIDEDMSFSLHDIMYSSNSYSAAVTFSQYLGITRKGRFGVFNEVELAMSGGDSNFHRPYNGEMRRTHTNMFQIALNFSPGVCVYVLDQVSFNVSLGVFGLNLKHEKQKVDGEDLGTRTTSGANFRFNLFNINFGIAINI